VSERSESNGIDALIDEAARGLVAGEPSSALRSSVRDRISRPHPVWLRAPAWGAAAAIVIASLIVGRALLGPPGERDNVRPTNHPASVPAIASQPNEPPAIQPAGIQARQFTRRLATVIPPPEEEEPLIPPIAIEPLATLPLRAVPLQSVQIVVDQSSGALPIDIAPLQIEPLLGQ